MSTVNFKIRGTNTNKRCAIHYYISLARGKRLRGSTNLKIYPKFWNTEKQVVKNMAEVYAIKKSINLKLDKFKSFVSERLVYYKTNDINTIADKLKTDIDIFLGKTKTGQQKIEFLAFFDWYIDHYKINPLARTGRPMSKATAKTYRSSYNLVKDFNDKVYKLYYDNITLQFYDDFVSYMQKKGLSLNYIGSLIKTLKTIMNASFEKDYHNSLDFKKKSFKKPFENVYNIYLNEKELKKINDIDLSNFKDIRVSETLLLTKDIIERSKDLFLIGAYTGLRVSDFNRLTSKHIIIENGQKYIRIKSQKTDNFITVPLHPVIKKILKKRGDHFPKRIPAQHLNYAIKKIGKIVKINEPTTKEITKGGCKTIIKEPKYKFISNHTARRSFCTNAYKSGMPVDDIMQISGHKSSRIFKNYIKLDDIEKAKKIGKHKFFN